MKSDKTRRISQLLDQDDYNKALKKDLASADVIRVAMGYVSDEIKTLLKNHKFTNDCRIVVNTKDKRTKKSALEWLHTQSPKSQRNDNESQCIFVSHCPRISGIVHSKIILLGKKGRKNTEPTWFAGYVGSSNLTKGGLKDNYELNVRFEGQEEKFDDLDSIIAELTSSRFSQHLTSKFIKAYDEAHEENFAEANNRIENVARINSEFVEMNTFNRDSFFSVYQFTITNNVPGSDDIQDFLQRNALKEKAEIRIYDKNETLINVWDSGVSFRKTKMNSKGRAIFRTISKSKKYFAIKELSHFDDDREKYESYKAIKKKRLRVCGRCGIQNGILVLELKIIKT